MALFLWLKVLHTMFHMITVLPAIHVKVHRGLLVLIIVEDQGNAAGNGASDFVKDPATMLMDRKNQERTVMQK